MGIAHQNPYLLHYCALKELPIEVEKQVIKRAKITFGEVAIDLAVIGSSHFLHLPNYFCEILSCLPAHQSDNLFFQQQINTDFFYKNTFQSLDYQIHISFHYFEKSEFADFEKDLLHQPHLLCHSFEQESAITAIQLLENQRKSIKIQTWHTYPEKLVAVQTQTIISI